MRITKLTLALFALIFTAFVSSCKKDEHGPHDDHDQSENEITLQVNNLLGQTIYSTKFVSVNTTKQIDVSGMPIGIYFIKLHANNKNYALKFIISE